jgi:hypothetical protein
MISPPNNKAIHNFRTGMYTSFRTQCRVKLTRNDCDFG